MRCPFCGETDVSSDGMGTLIHGTWAYRCNVCGKPFEYAKVYNQYYTPDGEEVDAVFGKRLTCMECGRRFDTENALNVHTTKMHGDRSGDGE